MFFILEKELEDKEELLEKLLAGLRCREISSLEALGILGVERESFERMTGNSIESNDPEKFILDFIFYAYFICGIEGDSPKPNGGVVGMELFPSGHF